MLPPAAAFAAAPAASASAANLKQQVAERLAAHRARRGAPAPTPGPIPVRPHSPRGRASDIAATVAERYANSPTYRASLAAQIEEAVQQANAAAQVAAVTAEAVAAAQYGLLADLDELTSRNAQPSAAEPTLEAPEASFTEPFYTEAATEAKEPEAPRRASESARPKRAPAVIDPDLLTVRLYEQVPPPQGSQHVSPRHATNTVPHLDLVDNEDEAQAMDEEIAFRYAPVFGDLAQVQLPTNLIEFPRELIAPRKARPRLAEGPLLEDGSPDPSQLRIFEVQPDQLSPAPALDDSAPVWSSIVLSAQPDPQPFEAGPFAPVPHTGHFIFSATPRQRRQAAVLDASVIASASALFASVFVYTVGSVQPTPGMLSGLHLLLDAWKTTALGLGGSVLLLAVLYQVLCYTLSDATFGMRRTRIALCTFNEQNPRRAQRLTRLAAAAASLSFLGLGLLWLYIDTDNLTLHDRLTKAYPRSY